MDERKTIRIRIAVAVESDGSWNSCGWANTVDRPADDELASHAVECLAANATVCFVEADVPLPPTIIGETKA